MKALPRLWLSRRWLRSQREEWWSQAWRTSSLALEKALVPRLSNRPPDPQPARDLPEARTGSGLLSAAGLFLTRRARCDLCPAAATLPGCRSENLSRESRHGGIVRKPGKRFVPSVPLASH